MTGIAALIKQKHPDWTPEQVKSKIMNSAVDLGYAPHEQGAGNANALYAIDDLAPISKTVINNDDTWTNSRTVDVYWECDDAAATSSNPKSGVRGVEYSVNGGSWNILSGNNGTFSVTFSGDGVNTVTVRCTDNGGNANESHDTIIVDTQGPTTSLSSSGTSGQNGWYVSDVSVSLDCADSGDNASGCKQTFYKRKDSEQSWTQYSIGGFVLPEGRWNVSYYSNDHAGNDGPQGQKTPINVDTNNPVTADEIIDGEKVNGWHTSNVTVKLTCSDSMSGCQSITYKVNDNQPVTVDSDNAQFELYTNGNHTVEFYSLDRSGRQEILQTISVPIDLAAPIVRISRPMDNTVYIDNTESPTVPTGLFQGTYVIGNVDVYADVSPTSSGTESVVFIDYKNKEWPMKFLQNNSDGTFRYTIKWPVTSDDVGFEKDIKVKALSKSGSEGRASKHVILAIGTPSGADQEAAQTTQTALP